MKKSVKSSNPCLAGTQACKSPPAEALAQAGVIQTFYDLVKAYEGELKVITKYIEGLPADLSEPKRSEGESFSAGCKYSYYSYTLSLK